jgi:hypothetical protein
MRSPSVTSHSPEPRSPGPSGNDGIEIAPPGAPPPRLEASARERELVAVDEDGFTDEDASRPKPVEGDPDEVASKLDPEPERGDANLDAFVDPHDGTRHVVRVYGTEVNELRADGTWGRIEPELAEDVTGWTASGKGWAVRFPRLLGPDPIRFELPDGAVEFVPSGVV